MNRLNKIDNVIVFIVQLLNMIKQIVRDNNKYRKIYPTTKVTISYKHQFVMITGNVDAVL